MCVRILRRQFQDSRTRHTSECRQPSRYSPYQAIPSKLAVLPSPERQRSAALCVRPAPSFGTNNSSDLSLSSPRWLLNTQTLGLQRDSDTERSHCSPGIVHHSWPGRVEISRYAEDHGHGGPRAVSVPAQQRSHGTRSDRLRYPCSAIYGVAKFS